ncbi:hypothetical protein NMY22_g3514 [Coprinellus aureogranulatus]|nr:hypothetical protein NMY22_g3514 [Coprinellus aureogranulatus]
MGENGEPDSDGSSEERAFKNRGIGVTGAGRSDKRLGQLWSNPTVSGYVSHPGLLNLGGGGEALLTRAFDLAEHLSWMLRARIFEDVSSSSICLSGLVSLITGSRWQLPEHRLHVRVLMPTLGLNSRPSPSSSLRDPEILEYFRTEHPVGEMDFDNDDLSRPLCLSPHYLTSNKMEPQNRCLGGAYSPNAHVFSLAPESVEMGIPRTIPNSTFSEWRILRTVEGHHAPALSVTGRASDLGWLTVGRPQGKGKHTSPHLPSCVTLTHFMSPSNYYSGTMKANTAMGLFVNALFLLLPSCINAQKCTGLQLCCPILSGGGPNLPSCEVLTGHACIGTIYCCTSSDLVRRALLLGFAAALLLREPSASGPHPTEETEASTNKDYSQRRASISIQIFQAVLPYCECFVTDNLSTVLYALTFRTSEEPRPLRVLFTLVWSPCVGRVALAHPYRSFGHPTGLRRRMDGVNHAL